ncbi:DNA replication factor Cdt1, putative [Pediculus humanus corporis]|uniref:DNA replication factor Cdt1, putative n=1 Tax=Pediculus humanus subsp. corporis TaxID=121224 RepID=E0VIT1_PEDHC|nr:DNA replication factor Cdt1, putative [Pediculus humanus corporis]EEB13287.1 DNA replication factor Cdt1, putative [Pediculus humanus corporis]
MSVQPSIASFFGKRKRLVTDDVFKSKLIKTESTFLEQTENYASDEYDLKSAKSDKLKSEQIKLKTFKTPEKTPVKKKKARQLDIRESLKKAESPQKVPLTVVSPVKFQLLGSLSPTKKSKTSKNNYNNLLASLEEHENCNVSKPENFSSTSNPSVKNLQFSDSNNECPTEDIIKSAQEFGISLKGIKDKINKSSKLVELQKSINKINQHAEELIEAEKKKLIGTLPKISKFNSFDIEVPISPRKHLQSSPVKQQKSPRKPAYERFASLVDSTTSLPLPFGYQKLYELFCATDTICSMITNRGELLTFDKLKPAVEEMTRKTFTIRHLGQIATVYPNAFTFSVEKTKNYGFTSKVDKYELVITPNLPENSTLAQGNQVLNSDNVFILSEKRIMTPKVMKARKDIFYKNLLEKTKDYHEEFLKTLDHPITINRNDLKRWHPEFMLDFVPDVNPQELPQPPNSERPPSAKEVLDRARNFLSSNVRVQNALKSVADGKSEKIESDTPEISPEAKAKIDARSTSVLKGIPKSLLEKVRAKQAAKALDVMRMTPEQEKETVMYTRLPEIARIIRTTFVNEQKGVLPLEILMEKVQFSYNTSISLSEIENHINHITKIIPDWLSIVIMRNVKFVKLNRKFDAASAMEKLKKVVEEKTKMIIK